MNRNQTFVPPTLGHGVGGSSSSSSPLGGGYKRSLLNGKSFEEQEALLAPTENASVARSTFLGAGAIGARTSIDGAFVPVGSDGAYLRP